MSLVQSRPVVLAILSLLVVLPGGCATCSESEDSGTYGEESANESMMEYEREEEMRESDL